MTTSEPAWTRSPTDTSTALIWHAVAAVIFMPVSDDRIQALTAILLAHLGAFESSVNQFLKIHKFKNDQYWTYIHYCHKIIAKHEHVGEHEALNFLAHTAVHKWSPRRKRFQSTWLVRSLSNCWKIRFRLHVVGMPSLAPRWDRTWPIPPPVPSVVHASRRSFLPSMSILLYVSLSACLLFEFILLLFHSRYYKCVFCFVFLVLYVSMLFTHA
jgi:hypothetical protein